MIAAGPSGRNAEMPPSAFPDSTSETRAPCRLPCSGGPLPRAAEPEATSGKCAIEAMRFRLDVLLAAVLMCVCASGVSAATTLPDFISLVAEHGPAVVNISATRRNPSIASRDPRAIPTPDLPEDSPYREFFRRYFFGSPHEERFYAQSLGSGFIISSDGYIICNHHVIQDADEVVVRLNDWREFDAEIVGIDERSDIGLLKIDAIDLPSVRIGAGNELQVGEWVLAIGSPFGFEHSATAGIVSAKGRSLPRENYVPFIQTDVAINPGNSGGPLFNLAGEVVGINSQIFSGTGGSMGLSFAIPIEVAMNVVTQLRERGRVSRGWLGVLIDDVSPGMAVSLDMDRPRGAWIAKVLPDGPAASAGLRKDDIVLEFDGNIVSRSSDLPPIVGRTQVGTRVPVKVLRNGEPTTLYVLTAELPGEDEIRLATGRAPEPTTIASLGIKVAEPTPEQRRQWGLSQGGVLVTEVEEGPAYRAGLRPGDLILSVEGADVSGAEELLALANQFSEDREVSILARRRGEIIAFSLPGG